MRNSESCARLLTLAVLAAAVLAAPVSAQTMSPPEGAQSDEIVVTAQRRAEVSRDVPITIASFDAALLATGNVDQLADTARLTSSLRFDAAGSFVQPSIRGVGTAITTSGGGPNVGIYVDGFFQSNSQVSDFQLMRVRNIQVLKGPQGTLFGRNTTGGAILVTTQEPSSDRQAQAKVSYGGFNTFGAEGYVSYGLGESAAVDVEAIYRSGDGFVTNTIDGDNAYGANESWSTRLGFRADLTDRIGFIGRYIHSETDDPTPLLANAYVDRSGEAHFFGPVSEDGRNLYQSAFGVSDSTGRPLIVLYTDPSLYSTDPDEVTATDRISFTNESDGLQFTVSADLGWANLTSYTQYRTDSSVNLQDLDATGFGYFYIYIGVDDETVSQEFLLGSTGEGPLQWAAGLNYFRNEDLWTIGSSFIGAPIGSFGGSGTTTTSYAAFADVTWEFANRWFLTGGARYSDDTVSDAYFRLNGSSFTYTDANGNPVATTQEQRETFALIQVDDLHNSDVTPRLVVRYEPSDVSSIYGSWTRGYKAGILNVGGQSQLPVAPEEIDAYELGYKRDDGTLSFDVAAFYYDYQNLQVSSFQNGAAQIRNAASSTIYGAEAQARWRATDALIVFGGAGYTHAEYESFANAPFYSYCDPAIASPPPALANPMACGPYGPGSLTQSIADASGFQMQRSPEVTANLGASYDLALADGELTLSGNLYYSSDFFFDPAEQFKQDAYTTLSLRAQWVDPSERFTLAVFGDNVAGERYQTQALFNTLGIGSVWSAPANWGVSAAARF